jgi:LmbE family N-acetylglucosaminyl deacetylase
MNPKSKFELSPSPSVLIVVAHPDDEILGFGGSAALLTSQGTPVSTCILSRSVDARNNRPALAELERQSLEAHRIVGAQRILWADFPNIQLNTVAHIKLVQTIEQAISESSATAIFTHHPGDLNDDHRHVSKACQAAARLFQRREGVSRLQGLYFMEVLSSTDWSFETVDRFQPTSFLEIGSPNLELKIKALAQYEDVMKPYPHPRSSEAIRALAALRGAQAGMLYAESFQLVFSNLATSFCV